ncbi:MAG: ARMT1-like domain-containing protein [Chloroflexota bacterium]|nr:ARMT1-like domain-containing protein [Chloroflexota bacterium]
MAAECYECLKGLTRQAAGLSTDDEGLRERALARALAIVESDFSQDELSIGIATKVHQALRDISGNLDPYRAMKDEEMRIARELFREVGPAYDTQSLEGCLAFAVLGNAIDFFRSLDSIREDMRGVVEYARDDSAEFGRRLRDVGDVLFLADNAGEVYFDVPLVKLIGRHAVVTYVVKESPVQNDLTLDDLRRSGVYGEFDRVMTTGTATPGVLLELASEEFRGAFERAGLVVAKGMGYYEALTELPAEGRVFHLLKAKCRPVADSLGVPVDSYVAILR